MKRFGVVILWIIGLYLVVRAIAEPFVIDLNDPLTYRKDWGGPSLAGVLLVHCGLGLIAAALMAWRLMRRSSVRLRRGTRRQTAAPRNPDEPDSGKEPGPPSETGPRSETGPPSGTGQRAGTGLPRYRERGGEPRRPGT